jgi:hypothetical protein
VKGCAMKFYQFALKACFVTFCVSTAIFGTATVSNAQAWHVTTTVLSDLDNPGTDIYTSTGGGGTANANANSSFEMITPNPFIWYNFAETSASSSSYYAPNFGSGHAYVKTRLNYTWDGGGTPDTIVPTYRKIWSVTPYSQPDVVGLYATASFDGVAVTVASGQTGWASYGSINTSPANITFSSGSTAGAGYNYGGGQLSRSSSARYEFRPN